MGPWSRHVVFPLIELMNVIVIIKLSLKIDPQTPPDPQTHMSSLVSPKLTRPTLFYVHCVPQEGGRMQGWESEC